MPALRSFLGLSLSTVRHEFNWDCRTSTVALCQVGSNGTEGLCAYRATRQWDGEKTCSDVRYGSLRGQGCAGDRIRAATENSTQRHGTARTAIKLANRYILRGTLYPGRVGTLSLPSGRATNRFIRG